MKLITEKTIEEKALSMEKVVNGSLKTAFKQGATLAESLILPKMIEFAEWLPKGRLENLTTWEGYENQPRTTSELLDIWIAQKGNQIEG